MPGFFKKSVLTKVKKPPSLIPKCGACGLLDHCHSPKMRPSGNGRKKILVLGEYPGTIEDQTNQHFLGPGGKLLRKKLKNVGIDLQDDCWMSYANICHSPTKPTNIQIESCYPYLIKTLDKLQPEMVILLGENAVHSLIGLEWGSSKVNKIPMMSWAGWQIPLQSRNMWLIPTFDPNWVAHQEEVSFQNPEVIKKWFERDLQNAALLSGKPWPSGPPKYNIQIEYDSNVVKTVLDGFINRGNPVSFDYETNMIKPDIAEAEIYSCSVTDGKTTIAYPWTGNCIKATSDLLKSSIPKYGWNIKFEERWTMAKLGHRVKNWAWDGLIATHIIDNRSGITSVKFQSFVQLGKDAYNDNIEKFFSSEHANTKNQIDQVDLSELLEYNGLDAILEHELCEKQIKLLNASEND